MTTVNFANPGDLDLDVIRVMGVSVKAGDNPIGYFGTGLKFAISTLVRTGHKIRIRLKESASIVEFGVEQAMIRGEYFNIVTMNGERLGFTTDLGKNWTVDDAYRELHSNCLDEGGTITVADIDDDVVISITGKEIVDAYYNRGKIFLQSTPLFANENIEVHPGENSYLFYRGVRVHKLERPSLFTYNLLKPIVLTEDRTAKSPWDVNYIVETNIPIFQTDRLISKFLENSQRTGEFYEAGLSYSYCSDPSDEFLDFCEKNFKNLHLPPAARKLVEQKRNISTITEAEKTDVESRTLVSACQMLKRLNVLLTPSEVKVVEDLGANIMACVKDGQIYLTRRCLAQGVDYTMITLYEEWIHRDLGYPDRSSGMQQHLFDKILELVKK